MAIDPTLLVSAAMLQDYLVDNATGLPLADGVVTLYKDNSRTTFKNWYYLSGTPGSYTFLTLPNPMTLSGVGTIQDGNGNDVIPFYYPYSETDNITPELYYIVVTNSNGQQQFTRQDFPFGAYAAVSPVEDNGLTMRNYIVNNVFWRNAGSINVGSPPSVGGGLYGDTIAPAAHDGLTMPDWQYLKNAQGATETLSFPNFMAGQFLASTNPQNQDVTPEYYLNLTCTAAGGETNKYVQVPISLHLKTLETTPMVLTLWYRCNSSGGTGGNLLTISIFQFAGTGATSPMPIVEQTITMAVDTEFTKVPVQFNMPSAAGIALGAGGDDALYLQIGFPIGQTFSIDIAKIGLYIGDQIPANDCDLYDQVDTIITSPRTGDIRTSVNAFYPFGWVPMDDGTIGNAGSNATTRANIDTWPLYSTLWNKFNPGLAMSSTYLPIYTAFASPPVQPYLGNITTYGASAIADWTANKALSLTRMLGRVLIGTAPDFPFNFTFTTNSTAVLTSGSTLNNIYDGMPVIILTYNMSGPPFANITYYIKVLSPTTFSLYWDPYLVNPISAAISTTGAGTAQVPDSNLGYFGGEPFGDSSGTFEASDGYPIAVTMTPATAIAVRNPFVYMNFYMKL